MSDLSSNLVKYCQECDGNYLLAYLENEVCYRAERNDSNSLAYAVKPFYGHSVAWR